MLNLLSVFVQFLRIDPECLLLVFRIRFVDLTINHRTSQPRGDPGGIPDKVHNMLCPLR